MFSWLSKHCKALIAKRRPKNSSTAPTEVQHRPNRPLTLVDIGRSMLRIKASDPDITDVELALRFDKSLDYVYAAIEAARRSYVSPTQPPATFSRPEGQ